MKLRLLSATAAFALTLGFSAPVSAQAIVAPCSVTEASFMVSGGFVGYADNCAGWFMGNDSNQPALVASTLNSFGMVGPYTELEKVEGSNWTTNQGPFAFADVYTNFALAVKAGSQFSLYYFSGEADAFSFAISAVKNGGSHYSIYGGTTTRVPEPGMLLLLGTGLLGMVMIRRRREDLA